MRVYFLFILGVEAFLVSRYCNRCASFYSTSIHNYAALEMFDDYSILFVGCHAVFIGARQIFWSNINTHVGEVPFES